MIKECSPAAVHVVIAGGLYSEFELCGNQPVWHLGLTAKRETEREI